MDQNKLFDEDLDLVDDLQVINFLEFGLPRQVYERRDFYNTLGAYTFRRRFRLSKEAVNSVLMQIRHRLEFPNNINNCVSSMNQLLVCLQFYATGGHLDLLGDYSGMHVATVSRIIVRVSQAIAEVAPEYIVFPNTPNEIRKVQQNFYNVTNFPEVVGAIDCSHFRMLSPRGEAPKIFCNRKNFFSINAQMICNANLKFLNVVARWPRSAHDSTIFNSSRIKRNSENIMYRNSLLLGDGGYACKNYLPTPFQNLVTPAEHLYNENHIATRNVVERLFGVLKRRFLVLAYGCRLKLGTFLTIIVATSVLHNICVDLEDDDAPPIPEELDEHILNELIENGRIPEINNNPQERAGAIFRRQLVQFYFQPLVIQC